MKLEYVPVDESNDIPVVRLYDFRSTEVCDLCEAFACLANRSIVSIELHRADYIDAVNGCRLTLMANNHDRGLGEAGNIATFQCALTMDTWDNIEGLAKRFSQVDSHGYQWLDTTDIPLLLSNDGLW